MSSRRHLHIALAALTAALWTDRVSLESAGLESERLAAIDEALTRLPELKQQKEAGPNLVNSAGLPASPFLRITAAQTAHFPIRTHMDGDLIELTFADTGRGIPPEHLERLFDISFARCTGTVKMAFGLVTAYSIIQEHGGTIALESEVGVGTTATVRLPWRPSDST